jgi:hypothetical protein
VQRSTSILLPLRRFLRRNGLHSIHQGEINYRAKFPNLYVSHGQNHDKRCCSSDVTECEVSDGSGRLKNTKNIERTQRFILVRAIRALHPVVDDPCTNEHLKSGGGYNRVVGDLVGDHLVLIRDENGSDTDGHH